MRAIGDDGEEPCYRKQGDHHKSEIGEAGVNALGQRPDLALEAEAPANQPQQLDATNEETDNYGGPCDCEVLPELPRGIDESPAIGADHQRAIGGISYRHTGGEQRGEYENMR